jgi:5-hydroxyisourate hydrolase
MNAITTHVLDTSLGRPAEGVQATVEIEAADGWKLVGKGTSDADGRILNLVPKDTKLAAGVYRLIFETGRYFAENNVDAFYPQVTIVFTIRDAAQHYHVPLLLSPFGYSTYRGS